MDIRYSHKKKQVYRNPEELFEIGIQEAQNAEVFRKRTQKAIKWYLSLIQRMSVKRIDRADFTKRGRLRPTLQLGHMYCYVYDAKTKDDLPYWDRFPLIFPIELTGTGWYGLNVHYVPIQLRAKLLSILYKFLNNKKYDETTRITITYQYLKSFAGLDKALTHVAFKQYLTSRVKSRFIHISPDEWPIALYLPMEQWQKKSFTNVYNDIETKIKQLRNK